MSTKGYSTQKKLIDLISGVSTKGDVDRYQTYQPNFSNKVGADVNSQGLYRLTGLLTVTAASTVSPKRTFTCTSHGGSVGDVVRFQPGSANPGFESTILEVPNANTIVLAGETPANIATSNEFYILRSVSMRFDDSGSPIIVSSSSPIQYVYDGADTEVELDTGTPGDSRPLPIWNVNSSGAVVNTATLAEQQTQTTALSAIQTAVQIMDDWDESDRAKVNPIVGQAGVQGGSGTVSANTQRVVLATDVALPAGTNNIGDVDVLSVPANMTVDVNRIAGTATAVGAGNTDAGTQRVVVSSNQTAIPVSQSGTWNVTPAANSSVNLNQIAGNGVQVNGGNRSTGTITVTICDNQPAIAGNITQINTQTVGAGAGEATAGTMRIVPAIESTATVTSVADSASSQQLLASNPARQMATFFNDSTESLYLKFGTTATTSDFTVRIAPGGYYELPGPIIYSGRIDGIWSANASGSVRITEW